MIYQLLKLHASYGLKAGSFVFFEDILQCFCEDILQCTFIIGDPRREPNKTKSSFRGKNITHT